MNGRDHQGLFENIAAEMEAHLSDDPVHDIHHAWRVCNLGTRIAEAEGADVAVVGAAALTHDLHRVGPGDGFVHPRETLPTVRTILEAAAFPVERVPAVCHCVAVHEEYDFEADPDATETLEAEVVQDADNLDAIGAVGIARTFAYGGAHGNPLWRPERDGEAVGHYDKAGESDDSSTIRHVHEKLLRLKDGMNTGTGRRLAAERHAYVEAFVDRFKREWKGEL